MQEHLYRVRAKVAYKSIGVQVRWKLAGMLIVAALLFWQRDGVACSLVSEHAGDSLESTLVLEADRRISDVYGKTEAIKHIVNASGQMKSWLFKANAYAKTITIPGKSCVVIGPNGSNIDILAHELVHSEIAHRIGYWAYLSRLPVWFNEGAAMQVDYRLQYDLPDNWVTTEKLRDLPSTSAFYAGDDAMLTKRYGQAKSAVAQWLKSNGGGGRFYRNLERYKAGDEIITLN